MNLTRDLIFLFSILLGYSPSFIGENRKGSFLVLLQQYVDICGNLDLFCRVGNFYSTFYFLIPLLFFSIFAFSYFSEKRRLLNGLLFNVFLISFGIYLFVLLYETQNIFLGGLIALITIPLLLVFLFGIYGLIVFLFGTVSQFYVESRIH